MSPAVLLMLPRSSSDVFELTSEFERQDKKLKTYSEISQTLSKVSHSAAQSVAPNLAEILLNHGQLKARLATSLDGVGHLWDEIFARVNREVNYIIDQQVEKAKGIIAQEVDRAIQNSAQNELQHQRDVNHASKRVRDDEDAYDREKRRRLNSWESPAAPQVQQNAAAGTTDVLQQMQTMITQSLASIQSLTQENQELKIRSSSKAPPTGPSAKRDSSPFSSNDRYKHRKDYAGESRYGRGGSPPREPGSSRDYGHGRSYDKYEKHNDKPNGNTWNRE
ncbi:hypothetical protein CYLTODRAFT_205523 [Cylindrobasidium torrendii FP15055 ss-10]|uniref:Uncharacterized protein n=1 Tax=Cylindrobasidium torrendii FP15055 ss-10 TaxID=1314674 RepID=A0A0D7BIA0_9AGAR|nr:hypothetical protein CYLTODRAFT_205523 [Cylindrobasidium torrendii FP15055 ss-10]